MKIAIVGMAFRLPGDLDSEDRFWDALRNSEDLVTTVGAERWGTHFYSHPRRNEPGRSITFSAGQLSRIDEFDAMFFGISPREARQMDPQQRLLLEMAWEAMENGGQLPARLAGSDCSVYIGISGLDYGVRSADDLASIDAYFMTGNTLSIAANRISYVFDLHGPSMAIDTACSSSLVALHQACQSLRNGEASIAISGGVHLLMHPYPFVGFTKASMLSAEGRCKTFDASGDGYVRSEGGAILILKPLEAALADGDPVHAVILASGVNSDGHKSGLTIPSPAAQANLMRACCAQAGVTPDDITYVEAHGTGTAVGDPIETAAIGEAIGKAKASPLYIGSVKSNLGHLEPVSGLAGLIKTVLCLKQRTLPPSLHLDTPNPQIDFAGLNLCPITTLTPLAAGTQPLRMGVNSFGFGGANAHVLVEEAPRPAAPPTLTDQAVATPPMFLSARHPDALRALAGRYAERLTDIEAPAYYDLAWSAAHRRQLLTQRLAVHGTDPGEIRERLQRFAAGQAGAGTVQEDALRGNARLAFVYSGNGAQWLGMGRALLAASAEFRATIEEIDQLLGHHGDLSILAELRAEPATSQLHLTEVAQPALFAIQVGVTRLLRGFGIDADAALGHSVGEVAAAWATGALTLAQAVAVIHERSGAQAETQGGGRMAAVGLTASEAQIELAAAGLERELEIAAHNSPKAITLSGSQAALEQLRARLAPRGVFFRMLDLDYAFHSWHMDGLKARILLDLADLKPVRGTGRFISTVTGREVPGDQLDAHYWWRNIRQPVRFDQAVMTLADQGYRIFLEIGPHAIMQRYIADCLAAAGVDGRPLATLKRDDDSLDRIAEAAYRAYLLGAPIDLSHPFPRGGRFVPLPAYPWQRERYWNTPTAEGYKLYARERLHLLLGYRLKDAEAVWENQIDPVLLPWLGDHRVGGAIVLPAAAFAELALAASAQHHGSSTHEVEELEIRLPIVLEEDGTRTVRFELDPRDGGFQIKSRPRLSDDEWSLNAVGRLIGPTLASAPATTAVTEPDAKTAVLGAHDHYRLCQTLGLDYGPAFQGMAVAWRDAGGLLVRLDPKPAELTGPNAYLLHPVLTDAAFQSLLALAMLGDRPSTTFLPVRLGRLRLYQPGAQPAWCRTRIAKHSPHSLLAEFALLDEAGRTIAQLDDCRFRAAPIAVRGQDKAGEWAYTASLMPHAGEAAASPMPAHGPLLKTLRSQLDQDALPLRRAHHFAEAAPLFDALISAFAYRALTCFAQPSGRLNLSACQTPAYLNWLLDLAQEDGLLEHDGDGWRLTHEKPVAAEDIWLTILRDNPAYLPELAIAGRIGLHLAEILTGALDGTDFATRLRADSLHEQLYELSPAHRAMNRGLRELVAGIARTWPTNRRLRILEISPATRLLGQDLIICLPDDRCDYVIADSDDETLARRKAESNDLDWVSCTHLDPTTFTLNGEAAPHRTFDLILVAHALHGTKLPVSALANLRGHLAQNGMLMVIEQHPDRYSTFCNGLLADWWRPGAGPCLSDPATWRSLFQEAGYVDIEAVMEPHASELHGGDYLLLARNPEARHSPAPPMSPASWLLLADSDGTGQSFAAALRDCLQAAGQEAILAQVAVPLSDYAGLDHVVLLAGLGADQDSADPVAESEARCLAGLDIVQAIEEYPGVKPRLWLVSAGGAIATSTDGRQVFGHPRPEQATLWGLGRVIGNEHPDLNCTRIDLQTTPDADLAARVLMELLQPDAEDEIILGPDCRHVTRMRRSIPPLPARRAEEAFTNVRLDFSLPGQLKNLQWHARPLTAPAEDEIEIQTRAVGLNFRDVMYAMGLLSDEAVENGFAGPSMGMEVAGIVTRVGTSVSEFKPGDAVLAFAPSGFAKRTVTKAASAVAKPEPWSFEEAATVPTVFFTVYYALHHLARLQPGERVLIHGAAGGVGIAAIQLARHLGAEIFATAGSEQKRDFVRLLGADHVLNSRSLAYADEILAITGGRGVDVVVNSLAGEAINRNFRVLRPFGRFLELGKRDFYENTRIGLRPFKDNITYYGIDADQLMVERPDLASRLFREMMALFQEGILHPLPHRVFPASRIVEAYRHMQQAKQIGKIVVSFQDQDLPAPVHSAPSQPLSLEPNATYLVTGGLGGFGLRTARWLAERGAGHLVLLGRRGADAPEAAAAIAAIQAAGARAHVMACDVTDADRLAAVIDEVGRTLPPIRGIVHAAMVLDDGLIRNLDHERFQRVLRPKIAGAWNLHRLTRHLPLDLFVLYSSATTFIGNPGQANYVAANAYLESLAALRRFQGLPATAVCWGAIADVGYLARNESVKSSLETRLGGAALASDRALAQLGELITDNRSGIAVFDFDWHTISRFLPAARAPRYDEPRLGGDYGTATEGEDIRALIANHSEAEAREIIRQLLTMEVAQILRLPPERIPVDRSLYDIGMDSLMGVELVLSIEKHFGINLPAMALSEGPTIQRISERLVRDLVKPDGTDVEAVSGDARMKEMLSGLAEQHGLEVSSVDIDATLADLQARQREIARAGS